MECSIFQELKSAAINHSKIKEILDKYGRADGLCIDDMPKFFSIFKDKRYCMLIYLKNPERVEPFEIGKKGYGNMAAWISVDDVNKIKK